jgi:hypothetical protein
VAGGDDEKYEFNLLLVRGSEDAGLVDLGRREPFAVLGELEAETSGIEFPVQGAAAF